MRPRPRGTAPRAVGPRVLYAIIVMSNPAGYARRVALFNQTRAWLLAEQARLGRAGAATGPGARDRAGEGAGGQGGGAPRAGGGGGPPLPFARQHHDVAMTLTSPDVLWAKENLINAAVGVLPADAHYFAWLDADVQLTSRSWVADTLDRLDAEGGAAFVQPWSRAELLGPNGVTVTASPPSFGAQWDAGAPFVAVANTHPAYWHCGFAWATTVPAWRAVGGLLQTTLGSADLHMAMALIGRAAETVPAGQTAEYRAAVLAWQERAAGAHLALGAVPGTLRHFWHGPLAKRRYMERWGVLSSHAFAPRTHMRVERVRPRVQDVATTDDLWQSIPELTAAILEEGGGGGGGCGDPCDDHHHDGHHHDGHHHHHHGHGGHHDGDCAAGHVDIVVWTDTAKAGGLASDVVNYFAQRDEDSTTWESSAATAAALHSGGY